MKKTVLIASSCSLTGALVFLLCLMVSSGGAATAFSGRRASVAQTPLELSVNIIGQREDRNGAVSEVAVREGAVLQSHDNFQVHSSMNRDAYVYILMFDPKGEVQPLFPDLLAKSGRKIRGRVEHAIPSEGQWFWLDENTGSETICVIASLTPLDDIRRLLNGMEGSGREKREDISRRVRQKVRSLEGATNNITEGKTKSFRLKDGKVIQNVTEIAKGGGSAVRTIRFAHIDGVALRTAGAETGAGEKAGKREMLSGSEGIILRGADAALAGVLEKAREGSGDEKNIAELLGKVKQSAALEETRGIGGIQIYKQLSPAVVLVATKEGLGSGSVIDRKGTVVTNWHVVKDHDRVVVFFKPVNSRALTKKDAYAAQVIKVDEVSDLALLRIDSPPPSLPVARLGSMKGVSVGQEVHAIGHPDGETWSYTKGIISQIRPVYEWSYEDGTEHKASVIQTQTPINPGNSGGPLLDGNGEIIGVNSFTKGGEGLNFAVSVDVIKAFLQTKESRVAGKPPLPEWLKNSNFYDVHKNENGIVDVVGVDTQKNGNIDFYLVREVDGSLKYIEFDRADGSVELRMYDTDRDGTWKMYAFYDQASKLYLIGISDHGDGKINRYEEP
jgi:S1-C subfamily serine protease